MTKRPSLADSMKAFAEPAPDPVVRGEPPVAGHVVIPRPAGKFYAKSREGMKRLLTPIEPAMHKRLKMLAIKQDCTLEALTRKALEDYLTRYD
jgi:hypothetical protein